MASLVALAESGLEYEVRTVDANNRDEIARINPWGRVPALVLGSGTVLTETVAILFHVADRVPARHLLPPSGSEERVQALSFLTLLASSVHIAFRPVLRPDRLATTMHAQADVRSTGVQMLDSVLGRLEREIAGEASVLESGFSLCDAYALVFAQWSRRPQVRNLIEPTPRLHAVARAVQARPAVAEALGAMPDYGD
ncbi:glutathione S-transferase [Novosphingobium sp. ST904]|nr:glutathione S-transferase [Novosphingobium sp. ST904]